MDERDKRSIIVSSLLVGSSDWPELAQVAHRWSGKVPTLLA
jgi:hypothetical protein